jgi:Tol biopolymer transport system component
MSSKDGNWEIYTMNADGSNQTRLTNNTARDFSPSWSPDGKKILFSSDRGGDADVHVMNVDGSDAVNIGNKAEFDNGPEWTHDGKRILFARRETKDGKFQIYSVLPDGSDMKRLTNNSFSDLYPFSSPDSKQIVFQSDRDGHRDIYVMNADGSGQRRLMQPKANE